MTMNSNSGVIMLELEAEGPGKQSALYPTLLLDGEAAILADTCMPGFLKPISDALQQNGTSLEKLTAIILTHQDLDHVGSLPELLAAVPQSQRIEVLAHPLDSPYIEGKHPLIKTTVEYMSEQLKGLPETFRRQAMAMSEFQPRVPVSRTLQDGDILPYCGGIQVVHTPGHTAGHISLYAASSKTLIAGDALVYMNGELRRPFAHNTLDMNTAVRSIKKLMDFEIEQVICFHGGLCRDNIREQLEQIVQQHEID